MFNNLLESSGKTGALGAKGSVFSVVLHTAFIAIVVVATANAGKNALDEVREEKVQMIEQKEKPPEPEKKPPPPDVVVAPPPPKGFQILTAPIEIPNVLPDIDLSKKMTDEADFTGKGVAGGTSKGVVGGVPQPLNNTEATYFDFQVEKQAALVSGTANPQYPEMLKASAIAGEVLAQFVIDTTGRADIATFKVLKSTHALFTDAVKKDLPRMRFLPAEVGGKKVKQLVQLPFAFSIK
jgi:protein TonB